MDPEVGVFKNSAKKKESWKTVLTLAYQSLGVVYGDLSTSPLYVYKGTFADDIEHTTSNEEIYGVLSFVFWTLTLIPLVKYVFIVLKADDNGEGGTFALYSKLCRHAKVSFLPNGQLADEDLSDYKKDGVDPINTGIGSRLKSSLEKYRVLQKVLLVLALIGTCMVIGDGVLTPAISFFSAVSGLELSMSKEHHKCTQIKAIVEYAPSQRVPKSWCKKDGREGTIHKDPEYLEFLEFLAKPVENLPSAEIQLEKRDAERAGASKEPRVTALMDFIRKERANFEKEKEKERLSSNGKPSRRGMEASLEIQGNLPRNRALRKEGGPLQRIEKEM